MTACILVIKSLSYVYATMHEMHRPTFYTHKGTQMTNLVFTTTDARGNAGRNSATMVDFCEGDTEKRSRGDQRTQSVCNGYP
jgi:hypothetical protein